MELSLVKAALCVLYDLVVCVSWSTSWNRRGSSALSWKGAGGS